MTLLADYLRDNTGAVHRIFPNDEGELAISSIQVDDVWGEPVYTIPTSGPIEFQTLADSAGTTWYIYPTDENELVITNTKPTFGLGTWGEPKYGTKLMPTESDGNIIYLALKTITSMDMYVYPNADGELIITDTEPT